MRITQRTLADNNIRNMGANLAAVAKLLEHALEVVAATVLHIALPPPAAIVTMQHVAPAATSSSAPAGLLVAQPDVERKSKSDQM